MSNSKFKVKFTLKQHTPIIHFQSEQVGATLRATELKPKFDKFLKKYAFNNKIPKNYKIKDDKDALDYKVNIEAQNKQIVAFEKYPPLYFARDSKEKVQTDNLTISFISFQTDLIQIIKDNFEAFLANTNFGSRQSKGYGCFYIKDKKFNPNLVAKDKTKMYCFNSTLNSYENDIKLFYGFLRAGINEVDFRTKTSRFYAKSLMFLYANSLGITWDKKAIKEHFLNHKQPSNHHLMKDLLGLSTNESWISYKMNIKKSSKSIDRYASPILFKPILEDNVVKIYFFASSINKEFLNQHFSIHSKGKPLQISTPKEFDIDQFLKHSFNVDIDKHIDKKYHKHKNFLKLVNIFKTLKAQVWQRLTLCFKVVVWIMMS